MKLSEDSQRTNKNLILHAIHENAPVSRIRLSQITSLNKATISNIVGDFLELDLLKEGGEVLSESGRKTTGLSLNMDNFAAVVLRIKRNHLLSGIFDMSEHLQNFRIHHYANSIDINSILNQMEEEIRLQISYCTENKNEIIGISIATLGYLYKQNEQYYLKVDGFKTLSDTDICSEMRRRFPEYRIIMEHDANASAMAEYRSFIHREGYPPSPLLNIVGGIGLGGGIIIDRHIFRGFHGIAGELGHLGINCFTPHKGINGDINYNGGIFEEYASPLSIRRAVIENLYDYPKTGLTITSTLPEIYSAFEHGDPLAEWAMNRAARHLSYGLTGLIFVLDPEVIVLGDEIPRSEKFVAVLNKFLDDFLPKKIRADLKIHFSEFTEDSSLIGAGIIMIETVLSDGSLLDVINRFISQK